MAVGPFSSNFADVGLVVGSFADRDNALRQLGLLQKKVNPAAFIKSFRTKIETCSAWSSLQLIPIFELFV